MDCFNTGGCGGGAAFGRVPVKSGVPQGSVFGPFLFLTTVYIIQNLLEGLTFAVRLFADDTTLE